MLFHVLILTFQKLLDASFVGYFLLWADFEGDFSKCGAATEEEEEEGALDSAHSTVQMYINS